MAVSPHSVLVAVCDEYDARQRPVDTQQIAAAVGTTVDQVQPVANSLCGVEFLARTASGYRPTVTAREFLELDVELTDVAVVELREE